MNTLDLGIISFILYYRFVQNDGLYRYPVPMWDGQRAVCYVHYGAQRFNINPNRIALFGFSAGDHLAFTIGLDSDYNFNLPFQDSIGTINARPNFIGLAYPVVSIIPKQYASLSSLNHLLYGYVCNELRNLEYFLSAQYHVNINTPPIFLFESIDDKQISARSSTILIEAMKNTDIDITSQMSPSMGRVRTQK